MKFKCQRSGKCCTAPEGMFVFLTKADIYRIEDATGLNPWEISTLKSFDSTRFSDMPGTYYVLNMEESGRCLFLKEGSCSINDAKPTQCRTWPFWPELVREPKRMKVASDFCDGIGKGEEIPYAKVLFSVREQEDADENY